MKPLKLVPFLVLLCLFLMPSSLISQNAPVSKSGEDHLFGGLNINRGFFRNQHMDGNELNTSESDYFNFSGEIFATYINENNTYYTLGLGYGRGRNTSSGYSDYNNTQINYDHRAFERESASEDYLVNIGVGRQFAVNNFRFLPGIHLGYSYHNLLMERYEYRYYKGNQLTLERKDKWESFPDHEIALQLGGQAYYTISNRFHLGLELMINTLEVSYSKGKNSRTRVTHDYVANTTETTYDESVMEETIDVGFSFYEQFGISLRYQIR